MTVAAVTLWGSSLTFLATMFVVLFVQWWLADADPRGWLAYVLGAATATTGIGLMVGV